LISVYQPGKEVHKTAGEQHVNVTFTSRKPFNDHTG